MSGAAPRVSVLLPVRDAAAELGQAIESVEAQTFRDFEVLAVDDGSRDETPAILAAWAARDGRVRLKRTARRGIARALDLALRAARAPLVARMDGDDLAAPERLAAQLEALETNPGLAVLGTRVEVFSTDGPVRSGMRRYERWLSGLVTPAQLKRDLYIESPLCHPSVMARREALLAVGGYRDVDGPEDYDLWLRLSLAGAALANLPRVLLSWRDRPGRATRTDRRYRAEAILRLKLAALQQGPLAGARALGIWGAGPWGKRWSRALRRRGGRVEFFVDVDPRKLGRTLHDAPILSVEALPPPGRVKLLVAVGVDGARALIRAALAERGWSEGQDFHCVQ